MKSKDRVSNAYKPGTTDCDVEYDMMLDDGVTCDQCYHARRCFNLGYSEPGRDHCDFYPSRFRAFEIVDGNKVPVFTKE